MYVQMTTYSCILAMKVDGFDWNRGNLFKNEAKHGLSREAKGGDLLALKAILGHSDLQMVQRYAHLAPEHLRRGIDRLNFSTRTRISGDDFQVVRRL